MTDEELRGLAQEIKNLNLDTENPEVLQQTLEYAAGVLRDTFPLSDEDEAHLDAAFRYNLAAQGPVPAWIDCAERDLIARGVPEEVAAAVTEALREFVGSVYAERWERDWERQAEDVAIRLKLAAVCIVYAASKEALLRIEEQRKQAVFPQAADRARLKVIVEQLRSCRYTCEAGPLENNTAFVALCELAESAR